MESTKEFMELTIDRSDPVDRDWLESYLEQYYNFRKDRDFSAPCEPKQSINTKVVSSMCLYEVRLKHKALSRFEKVYVYAIDSASAMATALDNQIRKGNSKLNTFDSIEVFFLVDKMNIL